MTSTNLGLELLGAQLFNIRYNLYSTMTITITVLK